MPNSLDIGVPLSSCRSLAKTAGSLLRESMSVENQKMDFRKDGEIGSLDHSVKSEKNVDAFLFVHWIRENVSATRSVYI